jgi:heme oxygenase
MRKTLFTATILSVFGGSESFSSTNLLAKQGNGKYFVLPSSSSSTTTTTRTTTNNNHLIVLSMTSTASDTITTGSFIETELRGAAMKLHTRSQAPKEGQAEEKKKQDPSYVTTHKDYLQFLVDSQYVYQAFEDVVNTVDGLSVFRNTGLERVDALEADIKFMVEEFNLDRPDVCQPGLTYAKVIRNLGQENTIPEFLCHFYNFYFAHTAGGRMIGKQMAALLLNKKTLEFYKWDGDLNKIKDKVKDDIEGMVSTWSRQEKDRCVGETAAAFRGGGAVNSHLSGGQSPH